MRLEELRECLCDEKDSSRFLCIACKSTWPGSSIGKCKVQVRARMTICQSKVFLHLGLRHDISAAVHAEVLSFGRSKDDEDESWLDNVRSTQAESAMELRKR